MEPKLRWVAALALVAALVALAGTSLAFDPSSGTRHQPAPDRASAFSWLRPRALAPTWQALPLPGSPARLPLPPGWRAADGDPGTRTAELRGAGGAIAGYLNATPRQGEESLANWTQFRIDHNREEGDRDVRLRASADNLRFAAAVGSCVLDTYRTVSGRRYREIACLVAGHTAATVIVAAATPSRWSGEAADLRRAVGAFTT